MPVRPARGQARRAGGVRPRRSLTHSRWHDPEGAQGASEGESPRAPVHAHQGGARPRVKASGPAPDSRNPRGARPPPRDRARPRAGLTSSGPAAMPAILSRAGRGASRPARAAARQGRPDEAAPSPEARGREGGSGPARAKARAPSGAAPRPARCTLTRIRGGLRAAPGRCETASASESVPHRSSPDQGGARPAAGEGPGPRAGSTETHTPPERGEAAISGPTPGGNFQEGAGFERRRVACPDITHQGGARAPARIGPRAGAGSPRASPLRCPRSPRGPAEEPAARRAPQHDEDATTKRPRRRRREAAKEGAAPVARRPAPPAAQLPGRPDAGSPRSGAGVGQLQGGAEPCAKRQGPAPGRDQVTRRLTKEARGPLRARAPGPGRAAPEHTHHRKGARPPSVAPSRARTSRKGQASSEGE